MRKRALRVSRLESLERRVVLTVAAMAEPVSLYDSPAIAEAESASSSINPDLAASSSPPAPLGASVHSDVALASIRDREIQSNSYAAFHAATAVPAVSPALSAAGAQDLIVRSQGTSGEPITAVVLKPRANANIYQIPAWTSGANAFEFLKLHFENAVSAGAGRIVFPVINGFRYRHRVVVPKWVPANSTKWRI